MSNTTQWVGRLFNKKEFTQMSCFQHKTLEGMYWSTFMGRETAEHDTRLGGTLT